VRGKYRVLLRMTTIYVVLFIVSYVMMSLINVGNDPVGKELIEIWIRERGDVSPTSVNINSPIMVCIQSFTLALFLFVIACTAIRMEWRTGAAILAITAVIFLSITPPQSLIYNAVEWNLILFLIGSMSFAGILREMGVFKYLSIKILGISKNNVFILIALIGLLALTLAMAVGEVTSIIYVVLLILELGPLLKIDVEPLIIFSVLATNTGSAALPIGNPIGIYLLFTTKMSVSAFTQYALPLSLLNYIVLLLILLIVMRRYISSIKRRLLEVQETIKTYITRYEIEFGGGGRLIYGLALLTAFIAMVALNDHITSLLDAVSGQVVDPHSLLAFIPYIFIVLSAVPWGLEEVPKHVERSVDWASLMFFICLFILSYSLTYTGVMIKLAYALSSISNQQLLLPIMLLSSASLSAVLDNLSVIVTLTPIAQFLNSLGLAGFPIYFALLFGGVFGGNYTPIGSTANIVAVSMAEKHNVRIGWGSWLRIALVVTTSQILAAILWLYVISLTG